MRTLMIPLLAATGLGLGGCAALLPAVIGTAAQHGLGAAVESATRGGAASTYKLESAAINGCRNQASQYGEATVRNVQKLSSTAMRVDGTVAPTGGGQQRTFTCTFRSGQPLDFRLG